jgi:hypothetical protein
MKKIKWKSGEDMNFTFFRQHCPKGYVLTFDHNEFEDFIINIHSNSKEPRIDCKYSDTVGNHMIEGQYN